MVFLNPSSDRAVSGEGKMQEGGGGGSRGDSFSGNMEMEYCLGGVL
jgi:hypothetical protein